MVMSGGGAGDPRDDPDSEKSEIIDCSYQNHTKAIFRKGRHRGSSFRRAILDEADLTEGDFSDCDFRRTFGTVSWKELTSGEYGANMLSCKEVIGGTQSSMKT